MGDPEMTSRSVYSIGASDGLWVGLLMGICTICMIMSANYPVLSLPGLAIFIATPFVVWVFLRRGWVTGAVPATFSAVWLHGICIFLFGALIMALIMYVTLKYLSPNWIENQTLLAVNQLSMDTNTLEEAHVLRRIVESGQLPSAIYTAISSIWLVTFTGSMMSMIFAFILTKTARYNKLRANYIANQTMTNGR